MHSFIKPRKKRLMDEMSSLWIVFISLMSIGLVGFGVYVNYKSSFYIKMLEENSQKHQVLDKKVKGLKSDIQIFSMQKELSYEVLSSNLLLKNSIKNLFDLVPNEVTLEKVVMEKYALELQGYARSKESYRLLLEPPLKSIFDESLVKFSINKKGFFQFVSHNKIKKQK